MAKIVKTTGEIIEISPKNGTDFKYDELHSVVDGYIEIVRLPHDEIMVVNEEGCLIGLEPNIIASVLANTCIVGDVLVCKSNEVK
jgi:hypothetical protein